MAPFRFLLACLIANAAQAVEPEGNYLADLPIVLTPSRLLQPLRDAPAAMTVIDRDMIRASGYRDLPRLLRLVPGMQVGQERGHAQWVTYHGMGNDFPSWMEVLVDGRSVYSPGNFDGVDWAGLPVALEEVERIEVLRGTNSAAFGSNAFLGVINIITRDSADAAGQRAALSAGTAGIRDLDLEAGGSAPQGSLRFNIQSRSDEGFAGLHDSHRFYLASVRGDTRLSHHDELMLRVAASGGSRDFGYPDSTFDNNAERPSDSVLATVHLQWKRTPKAGEEWLLHYYRNQDRSTDEWTASAQLGEIQARVPLNRNRRSTRDNIELQHRQVLEDGLRTTWGLELRRDRIDSTFLYFGNPRQQSDLQRIFGQADWALGPAWSINASAMAEQVDQGGVHVSPRMFALWKVAPQDTLRLGFARAWREPQLFERHGDIRALFDGVLLVQPYLPNPGLKAARMDSLELGYLGRIAPLRAQVDVRLFQEHITRFITRVSRPEFTAPLLASTLPSARYENQGPTVTLQGVEYQLDSRPRPGTRLLFSHTLIDRHSQDRAVTRLTAPYSASLSWFEEWGSGWSSAVSLMRMGPLAGGTGFVPRGHYLSPAYTQLDARLARRFTLDGTPAELALSANGLGDRHQEIADRSEQFLHGDNPVNKTSPMVWLRLTLQP